MKLARGSACLVGNPPTRLQLGGVPDWAMVVGDLDGDDTIVIARAADSPRLVAGMLLAGNLVSHQGSGTGLTVRNAVSGRVLSRISIQALHMPDEVLDTHPVASGDRVYALWHTYGLKHQFLLSFDALTGQLTGITDLTKVTGDICRRRTL